MTDVNKGIINSGTIGGNASVNVTEYGSGNVVATNSVVEVRQRAERMARALEDQQRSSDASELAAITAALAQLSQQAAAAAEARTAESAQLLAAIEALNRELAAGGKKGSAASGLYTRLVDAASKLADVAPATLKLAKQIGALIAL